MALSPENQSALLDFSRFGRRRREICLSEVCGEFNETKELRLFEEHFTRDEVASLLDGLLALVRSTLGRELKATFASCLLLTKQTLEQAQAGGVQIGFDVARAQDKALLREVEEWETKVAGGAVMQLLIKAGGSAPKALNSVGVAQDAATLMKLNASEEDKASLVQKFQELQVQCSGILKEKSALAARVEGLEAERAALSGSASAAAVSQASLEGRIAELEAEVAMLRAAGIGQRGGQEAALEAAQQKIASLMTQLAEAQTEIEARIEKSKQFANVRQMMAKKNEVIANLRKQLRENGIPVADDVSASD
mmetsp:Transcript_9611/g.29249  ORF Transcript_9611/g.29249 Transcript_9611/m.29249 type:complete len:309 (-) Transcript_9611:537-1463(-)